MRMQWPFHRKTRRIVRTAHRPHDWTLPAVELGVVGAGLGVLYLLRPQTTSAASTGSSSSSSTGSSSSSTGSSSASTSSSTSSTGSSSSSTGSSSGSSSSSSGSSGCQSPYGCLEGNKPTNCPGKSSSVPLGTSPVWHTGYGWVCQENGTATQQFSSYIPATEKQAVASGDPLSTYGSSVSGYNAKADAAALQQKLSSQYPSETFHIYAQNGAYSVLPTSRVKYLQSIGGTAGTLVS